MDPDDLSGSGPISGTGSDLFGHKNCSVLGDLYKKAVQIAIDYIQTSKENPGTAS